MILHSYTFERILKHSGAKRVASEASKAFAETMEEVLLLIARDAVSFAKHAGRKTVLEEDIRLASKKIIR